MSDTFLTLNEQGELSNNVENILQSQYSSTVANNHSSYKLYSFQKRGKYGFKNKSEKIIVKPIYEDVGEISENLVSVKLNGKWGFIDMQGNLVIPLEYKEVKQFSEGLVAASKNGIDVIFIDRYNNIVLAKTPFTFNYSIGLALDNISDREYCLLPEDYADCANNFYRFKEGICLGMIKDNNNSGNSKSTILIDKKGNVVNPINHYPCGSQFRIVHENNKYGFINKKGNYLVVKNQNQYIKD